MSFFHTELFLKNIYIWYVDSQQILQSYNTLYTTNQTYKLLSISTIVYIGTTRINFSLLIDHYWGPENIVHMKLASGQSGLAYLASSCQTVRNSWFINHLWQGSTSMSVHMPFKCIRLCICHETFSQNWSSAIDLDMKPALGKA
jgi:hypothetical protein